MRGSFTGWTTLMILSGLGCRAPVGAGACELMNAATPGGAGPFPYCTVQDAELCLGILGSHGGASSGYTDGMDCESAGYSVCCATRTVPVWFETSEDAEAARQANAGESCQPC